MIRKPPFFSIIVPCYNSAAFITRCIRSIQNQSFDSYEVIFIDDFSPDNTSQIIKNYKEKKFRIFKLKKNLGPAAARNFGIKKSRGKYICFLDSDDWWFDKN